MVRLDWVLLAASWFSLTVCVGGPGGVGKEELRVVCFGDSITGSVPRDAYLQNYVKWSDLLSLMIEAKVGEGKDVVVLNRGLAGDTTYLRAEDGRFGAVKRMGADIVAERPEIVVILIGGNDKKETEAERRVTRENLEKIVTGAQKTGAKVLVLKYAVLGPAKGELTEGQADTTWYSLKGNNDLIAGVAAREGVATLELQEAFEGALGKFPREALVNKLDGVHLNPAGELTMARAVFGKLSELGWVK